MEPRSPDPAVRTPSTMLPSCGPEVVPGDRVAFVHPTHGVGEPAGCLLVGRVYEVAEVDVAQSRTMLGLRQFPGRWFNSVLFAPVGDAARLSADPVFVQSGSVDRLHLAESMRRQADRLRAMELGGNIVREAIRLLYAGAAALEAKPSAPPTAEFVETSPEDRRRLCEWRAKESVPGAVQASFRMDDVQFARLLAAIGPTASPKWPQSSSSGTIRAEATIPDRQPFDPFATQFGPGGGGLNTGAVNQGTVTIGEISPPPPAAPPKSAARRLAEFLGMTCCDTESLCLEALARLEGLAK